MKILFLVLLLGMPVLASAQKIDSLTASHQIDSLVNLCEELAQKTQFEAAIQAIETGEKMALEQLGKNSAAYANCTFNHGLVLHASGKMEEAEPFYRNALKIREKVLGKENSDYANSVYNLASLLKDRGDYEEAEQLYLQSIDIRARVLGKNHPDYAQSLNYLSNLYRATGEYEKAESYCLQSMEIREKELGKENADYAWSLNSLANIYTDKGDYAKAERLYQESLDIRARVLGKEDRYYATSLNNLGFLYVKKGEYIKAESLYLEAKDIRAKKLGRKHPAYAVTLNNLADLYYKKGEYDKVEALFLEAKDIQAEVFGKKHPDYALSLDNLANLYKDTGQAAKAEPLYLEARDIRAEALGKEHPDYSLSLNNLAVFYTQKGDFSKAKPFYLEAMQHTLQLINNSANYSSETQQNAYLHTFNAVVDRFYAVTLAHPDTSFLSASYNNALFFNGYLLDNSRLLFRAYESADSLTRATYENWQAAQKRLAKRYARPIAERKKVAEVEAEAEGYEKMLLRSLPAFQQTRKIPRWQEVQAQLKPEEAALEFIHFKVNSKGSPTIVQYAALLLQPGWNSPKMIPLFEEKQLESLLPASSERRADYVQQLYSISSRGIIEVGKPQKALFELIWQPLENDLKNVKTVFYASTGLLHRLNLGAIPLNADTTMADRYRLIGLGSTRQLAFKKETGVPNKEAILFGGIQFEMDSTAFFEANERFQKEEMPSRGANFDTNTDFNSRGGAWDYLKWTDKEVKSVSAILTEGGLHPETLTGYNATEEAFKSIGTRQNSPRIIHLATHGFFFPDPKENPDIQASLLEKETGFITSDNPLIRSGLLLAGANYAWKSGKPFKKTMENGILTAFEISHLNLRNTELVVLSACETGLGDIEGNEGVYGLQRAFKLAGAQYLIMSLWKVKDLQTKELMTTFYSKWIKDKMELPEAFYAAQKEMREKYKDPYFWAGFVLLE